MKDKNYGKAIFIHLFAALALLQIGSASANSLVPITPDDNDLLPTKGYFTITPDYRRCASPFCGGYWIKSVNQRLTRCTNGKPAAQCYVQDVILPNDAGDASDIADGRTLVRGEISKEVFKASAAYSPIIETKLQTHWATYNLLYSTGIFCITTPCPSFAVKSLNIGKQTSLNSYTFDDSFNIIQQEEVINSLSSPGALVFGKLVGDYREGNKFLITNAYRELFSGGSYGKACGGLLGLMCGRDEFCNTDGHCGIADQTGTCQSTPQFCLDIYQPVCGCDGITYSNSCYAHSAGVSVLHKGECSGPRF